jgi:8-oxo-dGTP diphosphatase
MDNYACALLLREGKILLGKRAPHRRAYPNCWDVIGGRVEAGETLEAALTRELGEELDITPTDLESLATMQDCNPGGRGTAVYHFFVVRKWSGGEPAMNNDEHSAVQWFDIDAACALPDLALAEYPELFRRITC